MRIIGGHDYYDNAMSYGIDTSIVFKRERLESAEIVNEDSYLLNFTPYTHIEFMDADHSLLLRSKYFRSGNARYEFEPIVIYYAGIRYNGIKAIKTSIDIYQRTEITYYWTYNALIDLFHAEGAILSTRIIHTNDQFKVLTKQTLETYFQTKETQTELNWLIENKVCIAIKHQYAWSIEGTFGSCKSGWKINCDNLKQFQFYKALDSYQAFQNLEQFVTGVLPSNSNPPVEIISEKVKLQKHGMDKYSFKNTPKIKKGHK